MSLTFTESQVMKYCFQNQDALLMIHQAVEDYMSARCLLLNGFFPGLVFSAQAVEKYLKGYLLLVNNKANTKKSWHKMMQIKNEIQSTKDFGLDKYNSLIERLEKHYLTRYPDNKDASKFKSTGEILEIDEFIFHLNENLPIPVEVKYRTGLYARLFPINETPMCLNDQHWIITNNIPLLKNLSFLQKKNNEVINHLFPSSSSNNAT